MNAQPLPTLPPGAIPARVRESGPDAVSGYRAALSFERVLLTRLLDAALPSQGSDPRVAALPGALADAIVEAGGTGLADDLYQELEPQR